MLAMAVGADGDVPDPFGVVFAMNSLQVIPFHSHMAAAASPDDILSGDRGRRVSDLSYGMSAVAISTVG